MTDLYTYDFKDLAVDIKENIQWCLDNCTEYWYATIVGLYEGDNKDWIELIKKFEIITCIVNIPGTGKFNGVKQYYYTITFKGKTDAALFKLTWHNN